MLAHLLESMNRGARLAALVAVALAVGAGVGAAALTSGPTRVVTVADGSPSAADDGGGRAVGHDKARNDGQRRDKPSKKSGAKVGAQAEDAVDGNGGVHGRCVSAVARDKEAVGGPHDNHGWAVSRAAHTCPHPTPTSSGGS